MAALDGQIPAALARRQLSRSLRGEVSLDRLQWRPPASLGIRGLRLCAAPPGSGPAGQSAAASSPGEARDSDAGSASDGQDGSGRPGAHTDAPLLLAVDRAEATLDIGALRSRQLRLTRLRAQGVAVVIEPAAADQAGTFGSSLAAALAPAEPASSPAQTSSDWRIDLANVAIAEGSIVHRSDWGSWRYDHMTARDLLLALDGEHVLIAGSVGGELAGELPRTAAKAAAQPTTRATTAAGPRHLVVGHVGLHLEPSVGALGEAGWVSLPGLEVTTVDATLRAAGSLRLGANRGGSISLTGDLHAGLEGDHAATSAGLAGALLETTQVALPAAAHLDLAAHLADDRAELRLDWRGPLQLAGGPTVGVARLRGHVDGVASSVAGGAGEVAIAEAHLAGEGAELVLAGRASLAAGGAGAHTLQLSCQRLPVASWWRRWLRHQGGTMSPALARALPAHVSGRLALHGDTLWRPAEARPGPAAPAPAAAASWSPALAGLASNITLAATAEGLRLATVGVPDPLRVDGQAEASGGKLHLRHLEIDGAGLTGHLAGELPAGPEAPMQLEAELSLQGESAALRWAEAAGKVQGVAWSAERLLWVARASGRLTQPRLQGSLEGQGLRYRASLPARLRAHFALQGDHLKLADARLEQGGNHLHLDADLSGLRGATPQVTAAGAWQVAEVGDLGLPVYGQLSGSFSAEGGLRDPSLQLSGRWRRARGERGPTADLRLLAHGGRQLLTIDALEATLGAAGTLSLTGEVDLARQTLAAHLSVERLAAAALASYLVDSGDDGPTVDGELRGSLGLSGPWQAPDIQGELRASQLRVAEATLGEVGLVLHTEADLWVGDVRVRQGDSEVGGVAQLGRWGSPGWGSARGTLALAPLNAQSFFPHLSEHDADAAVNARGTWAYDGPSRRLDGSCDLQTLVVSARGEALSLIDPVTLALENGIFTMGRMVLSGRGGRLEMDGTLGHRGLRAGVRGEVNFGLLGSFVPGVAEAQGRLLVDTRISGTPSRPVVDGTVDIAVPLSLRLRALGQEIALQRGRARFDAQRIVLDRWRGSFAGGSLEVDGEVGLTQARPSRWQVNLRGRDVPFRNADLFTESDLHLALTGDGLVPSIGGKVVVTRGRYTRHLRLDDMLSRGEVKPVKLPPAANAGPSADDIPLDVQITTGEDLPINVDFGTFAMHTDLSANLHLGGRLGQPRLDGPIHTTTGDLRFPQASLELVDGHVDLASQPQGLIKTTVRARAEGPVTARSGNIYGIEVRIEGSLDGKIDLALISTPTLPSRLDILSLLTTGHENLSLSGGAGDSQLNTVLAFAGARVSEPLTRFATDQLQQHLKVQVELGAEVSQEQVKLKAAKQVASRLRLEGDWQRGFSGGDSGTVAARARVSVTDRLLLEANQQLPAGSGSLDQSTRTGLQLKWRFVGH